MRYLTDDELERIDKAVGNVVAVGVAAMFMLFVIAVTTLVVLGIGALLGLGTSG